MGNKRNIIVTALFYLIVGLVSVPLIQQLTGFAYVRPLKGGVKAIDPPVFENWFSGEFQQKADNYINTSFGFRPSFVRLHNQLDYWLFNVVNANNVIIGKDGYLYEYSYIKEYLGKNFLGKDEINKRISKLKSVSDTLAKRNIDIVVLLAAGKASYFPEYFPDSLHSGSKTISNYDYFSFALDSAGLKYIDFNKWFVNMKDTSRYALYTKGGIHWSKYGEFLVADSIIKYVENLKGIILPYYNLIEIETSLTPRFRDNDIGEGMNLIFPHSSVEMAYPITEIVVPENSGSITASVVADSYFWEMYNEGLLKRIFSSGQFWYYNRKIHSPDPGWYTSDVESVDVRQETEKNDVIFILQTEATLYRFAFGYLDKLIEVYKDTNYVFDTNIINNAKVNAIIEKIRSSESWYSLIERKAKKRGIPVEKMLEQDARYLIGKQKEKDKN